MAVVARRDAGVHAAAVLVEEMVADGLPVVVLDTKGTWHGIRRATDRLQPGLPVQVFGGAQGGVEVRHTAGGLVADCAVGLSRPLVVDLSGMPKEAAVLFVNGFVAELRRRTPRAMHLVFDDARTFLDESNPDGVTALLELLSGEGLGRVGATVVTDSPRHIDRRVLACADALVAGPIDDRSDQDVVWRWMESRSDRKTATRIVESLARLPANQAWVCSTEWLGSCQRLTLRPRATCAALPEQNPWSPAPPQSHAAAAELLRLQSRLGDALGPAMPEPTVLPRPAAVEPRRAKPARDERVKPRRGRPVAELVLAGSEKLALEQYAAQQGARAAVAQRARIILACAEGRLNGEVARELGITIQMVGRWRRRFVERRLEGLLRVESVPAGPRFRERTRRAATPASRTHDLSRT
jgi:hypothetical protein